MDLLEQVFKLLRTEAGFQEDKYQSLYLPLRWSHQQLESMLDSRLKRLIEDTYTGYEPTLKDVLPVAIRTGHGHSVKSSQYILERTWNRPRDAIQFLNLCIGKSEGKAKISRDAILNAEGEYSRKMLRALSTEWHAHFTSLPALAEALLSKRTSTFALGAVSDSCIEQWALLALDHNTTEHCKLRRLATAICDSKVSMEIARCELFSILYQTGCVGVKLSSTTGPRWASNESYAVSPNELLLDTTILVHPGLWRVLGIDTG